MPRRKHAMTQFKVQYVAKRTINILGLQKNTMFGQKINAMLLGVNMKQSEQLCVRLECKLRLLATYLSYSMLIP